MAFKIICPYCFEEMNDNEVLFRSEKVEERGQPDMFPDGYEDIRDFDARYRGKDKNEKEIE